MDFPPQETVERLLSADTERSQGRSKDLVRSYPDDGYALKVPRFDPDRSATRMLEEQREVIGQTSRVPPSKVYDVVLNDVETTAVVQEYVPESFNEYVADEGLTAAGQEAGAALAEFIHDTGYVYTDFTPENVRFKDNQAFFVDVYDDDTVEKVSRDADAAMERQIRVFRDYALDYGSVDSIDEHNRLAESLHRGASSYKP